MGWLVICASLLGAAAERVVFRWAPLTDAVSYELQIAADPEFRDVLAAQRVKVPGYRWPWPGNRAVVYFRVRGWDADKRPGEWSEARELKRPEKPPPPGAPEPRGPDEKAWWRVGRAVALTWTSPASAVRWHVELVEPGRPVRSAEVAVARFAVEPSRPGVHRWRVRGVDTGGRAGPWSRWSRFDARLPPPSLLGPADGARGSCGPVALAWRPVHTAGRYEVELARDRTFGRLVQRAALVGSSWTSDALGAGRYWWRVRARERGGRPGLRSTRAFTIVCLAVPELVAPADGAEREHGGEVRLEWREVASAARYEVEVGGELRAVDGPALSLSGLPPGEQTWRVRPRSPAGEVGPWSELRSVRLVPPRTVRAEWSPPQPRAAAGGEAVLTVRLLDAGGRPVRAAPLRVDASGGSVTSVTETGAGYRVVFVAAPRAEQASISVRDREFVARTPVELEVDADRHWQIGARFGWQLSGGARLGSPAVTAELSRATPLPLTLSARVGYLRHAAAIPASAEAPEPIDQAAHVVPVTVAALLRLPVAGFELYGGGGPVVQIAALTVGPETGASARLGFEAIAGGSLPLGPGFVSLELSVALAGLDADLLRLPTDTVTLSAGYRLPAF